MANIRETLDNLKLPSSIRENLEKDLNIIENGFDKSEIARSEKYLDWVINLPWYNKTIPNYDIPTARSILNSDHHSLKDVKTRILEFIAVLKLNPHKKPPILCLHGPPGVGKTTIAKNIAVALNRKFERISLGGIRDESHLRGFGRTYLGALPGKLIQILRQVKSINPLVLLDELDKIQTAPASALLEILDPEQNHNFVDHYLQIPFDLSQILYVATANYLETIPEPLKDRLEIITIPPYSKIDAYYIGKNFLLPKQILEHGLDIKNIEIDIHDRVIGRLVDIANEPGVRKMEQLICKILRKIALEIVENKTEGKILVTEENLDNYISCG